MPKLKKRTRFIPRTPAVIKILRKYWMQYKEVEAVYKHSIAKIESEMQKEFKEPDLEFYFMDGDAIGIGTPKNLKKMKLVNKEKLE